VKTTFFSRLVSGANADAGKFVTALGKRFLLLTQVSTRMLCPSALPKKTDNLIFGRFF